MELSPEARVTAILDEARSQSRGEHSIEQLLPVVYEELRLMAQRRLRHERDVHTLSPTELVHEAYLRLTGTKEVTERGRAYFFAAAAQAMRRIVVDHARRRGRQKRGGGRIAITLDDQLEFTNDAGVELPDIDDGLRQLALIAERPARVVECRFFGGLSIEDTALALGITPRTVNRDWSFARAWLFDHLKSAPSSGAS
jgi:RNA polymerase sigma-70 factor (ECF subfamily)